MAEKFLKKEILESLSPQQNLKGLPIYCFANLLIFKIV